MKTPILASALLALCPFGAFAQMPTSDAAWCRVLEHALADRGVVANVRADVASGQKVLHVTAEGFTAQYIVPTGQAAGRDYSSPVCLIVDNLTFAPPRREGGTRQWLGDSFMSRIPEEVFSNPADGDALQAALRTSLAEVKRVQLIDGEFADRIGDDADLYILKGTIVSAQRGETYAAAAPPPAGPERGGMKPAPRKVERKFAHARLHLEMTDYRTGAIVWSQDYSANDNTATLSSDPMADVIRSISRSVKGDFAKLLPTEAPRPAVCGNVLRVDEVKKDKAESLFIDLGHDQEVRKGDTFNVFLTTNVEGHTGQTPIGHVTVTEVQGPTLTLCNIKKGGKEILAAIQAGTPLVVETRP